MTAPDIDDDRIWARMSRDEKFSAAFASMRRMLAMTPETRKSRLRRRFCSGGGRGAHWRASDDGDAAGSTCFRRAYLQPEQELIVGQTTANCARAGHVLGFVSMSGAPFRLSCGKFCQIGSHLGNPG
jgi:hypothetical protein